MKTTGTCTDDSLDDFQSEVRKKSGFKLYNQDLRSFFGFIIKLNFPTCDTTFFFIANLKSPTKKTKRFL